MMSNIHTKLMLIQAALKAPKSQYNSFAKFNYRNLEDILEAVKPLLNEHGLTLTISDEPQKTILRRLILQIPRL